MFVANDDMAIGVVRAVTEAGRRVPSDLGIVGVDDIPAAAFLTPPPTSVVQRFDPLAAEGVSLLVDEIDSPTRTEHVLHQVEPTLAVRASAGPATV